MTFWSSQTLEANVPNLFPGGEKPRVDCNAVTLTVGQETYVTPSWTEKNKRKKTLQRLAAGDSIFIPPGQFGFLQSAESLKLSSSVMGFISFKATYKMMGLVNVSGFHVDPGWEGPLRFAMYNAGPVPVHIKAGMELFLLWVANLDQPSEKHRTKPAAADDFIRTVNSVSGPIKSGYDLSARVDQIDNGLRELKITLAVILALAVAIFGRFILSYFTAPAGIHQQAAPAEISVQVNGTSPLPDFRNSEVGPELAPDDSDRPK